MEGYFDHDAVLAAAEKVDAAQNKFWKAVEEGRAEHLFDANHNVKVMDGYENGGPCSVFAVDRDNTAPDRTSDKADSCDFNSKKGC